MLIRFFIPARPVPKQSYRASRFGGYQPKRVTDFKKLAMSYARAAAKNQGWREATGPLRLSLTFRFRCPSSARKAEKIVERWHTKRPDLDNIEKAVTDGIAVALMDDDSLVCSKRSRKIISKFGDEEGISVTLETLPPYKETKDE